MLRIYIIVFVLFTNFAGDAPYYRPLQPQHCRGRVPCGVDAYEVMKDTVVLNQIKPEASEFERFKIKSGKPFQVRKTSKRWNSFGVTALNALKLVNKIFFSGIPDY